MHVDKHRAGRFNSAFYTGVNVLNQELIESDGLDELLSELRLYQVDQFINVNY